MLSRSGGNVVFFLQNTLSTYKYYFLYFSVCYYLSRYCMVLQGKESFGIFWYFSLNFSYTNYGIPYTRTRENVIVLKVLKVSICTTCKLLHIICKSHIHVHHLIIIVSWRCSVDAPASRSSSLGSSPGQGHCLNLMQFLQRRNKKYSTQNVQLVTQSLIIGMKGLNLIISRLQYTVCIIKWSVVFRYGIHLWDIGHTSMWEGRSTWCYNTDLMMDLAMYTVDFAHHLHMLVRNSWLTSE